MGILSRNYVSKCVIKSNGESRGITMIGYFTWMEPKNEKVDQGHNISRTDDWSYILGLYILWDMRIRMA